MLFTIDSSVFVSAFLTQEPFHPASKKFLEEVRRHKGEVILPISIPLEVVNTLRRQGIAPHKGRQLFQSFFESPRIRVVALDQAFASLLVEQGGGFDLKTADWLIAETCFHFKSVLITWDKLLLERTGPLLSSKTPNDWLKQNRS